MSAEQNKNKNYYLDPEKFEEEILEAKKKDILSESCAKSFILIVENMLYKGNYSTYPDEVRADFKNGAFYDFTRYWNRFEKRIYVATLNIDHEFYSMSKSEFETSEKLISPLLSKRPHEEREDESSPFTIDDLYAIESVVNKKAYMERRNISEENRAYYFKNKKNIEAFISHKKNKETIFRSDTKAIIGESSKVRKLHVAGESHFKFNIKIKNYRSFLRSEISERNALVVDEKRSNAYSYFTKLCENSFIKEIKMYYRANALENEVDLYSIEKEKLTNYQAESDDEGIDSDYITKW
jgi:hypothetical protein